MKFCPECGTLMVIKKEELICPKCGYGERRKNKKKEKLVVKEKMNNIEKEKNIEVIFEDEEAYPISEETVCPKCGKKGAYYFFKQTRSSDEAETRFLKCIHCGYVWREYD